jgi:hypothetical protein
MEIQQSTSAIPHPTSPATSLGNSVPPLNSAQPSTSRSSPAINDLTDVDNVVSMKLWLPSDFPAELRARAMSPTLIYAEHELLQAELHDCLVTVRKYRRALVIIRKSDRGDATSGSAQAMRTRQREKISGIGEKIEKAKLRYQQAWKAAHLLDPSGTWLQTYRWLDTKDIRGPSPADDLTDLAAAKLFKKLKNPSAEIGQGVYEQSWIWRVALSDSTEPEDALRVQWAKLSANASRWNEELALVPVEMGRTLTSLEWSAAQWEAQVGRRPTASPWLQAALDAYALRQAATYRDRMALFATAWIPRLARHGTQMAWMKKFSPLVPTWAWTPRKRGDPVGCECPFVIFLLCD